MIENSLGMLKDNLTKLNSKEGMGQYLMLVYAEDIIMSPDLMVINLINSNYHGLDVLDFNMAIIEAQSALERTMNTDAVDVEVSGNKLRFRPKIVNDRGDTSSFLLMTKDGNNFALREVYEKYFKDKVSLSALTNNIYINSNSTGLLTSDSNMIVYDETIPFMREALKLFINGTHVDKLLPKSKVAEYMIECGTERESRFDFIVSNINDVMVDLYTKVVELSTECKVSDEHMSQIKVGTLMGNVTLGNLKILDSFDKPGYSIGLFNAFSKDILRSINK